MKFLADENIGLRIVAPLRFLGFDIKSVIEISKGATDANVLSLANKEPVFAKEESSDARAAVDNLQEKLARLIIKNKDQRIGKLRKNIKRFKNLKFWGKKDY